MQSHLYSTLHNAVKTPGTSRPSGLLFVTVFTLLLLFGNQVLGQITGTVYRDFNADGTRTFTAPATGEIGVGGVTVTVYSGTAVVGSAISSTVAATQGNYSITPSVAGPYRVQFTIPVGLGYFEGPRGTGSGTSVQFVASATTANVNLGVNYPTDYCQANPFITVPCYVNGNPTSTTGNAGAQPVLLSVPYGSVGTTPTETILSPNSQIGTVYGVAYNRATKYTFTAAFVKRHSGLGSGGAGAIYLSRPGSGTAAYTNTVFATIPNAGTVLLNDARGLTGTTTNQNRDPSTFDQVGKAGLGDLEISEDGTQLYVVNLADRRLYQVGINSPNSTSLSVGAISSFVIPTPALGQATGSVFRPFGLKYYRGRLYVGGVTTNEAVPTTKTVNFGAGTDNTSDLITRDTVGMKAVVFEFNPSNGTFNNTPVLSFPLTYKKGADNNDKTGVERADRWLPWTDIQPGFGTNPIPTRFARVDQNNVSYPQAMLTGIEFDVNGNMIISLRDRFGDQYGNNNFGPNTASGNQAYRAIGPGDLLQAGKCNPTTNLWTIENNARTCTTGPTAGANNGEGIGGGEYYFSDDIAAGDLIGTTIRPYHREMSEGGLAVLPGTDEVASIALDPYLNTDAGGIRRFKISTGTSSTATSVEIYYSGTGVSTYGKANGLGDLELTCDPAPIEIGNRIFNDGSSTTADGLQGSAGSSINGVTVQLYKNNVLIAQTVTNANGEYYFNNSNVTGGLLPLMAYEIRVPLSQTALAGYVTTQPNVGSDESIDSDGISNGTNAVIALTTGNYGENNHTYDIGFTTCATISNPSVAQSVCSDAPISSLSVATTSTDANSIRFVAFTSPQSGTAMYSGGIPLGTVTPVGGVASFTNTAPVSNTTNAPVTYYVYAVLNPTPGTGDCRPSQLIQITIKPIPVATATGGTITCLAPATVTGTSSVTGSTFSWTRIGGGFTSTAASFTTNTAGSYVLTVTANGCTGSTSSATAVVTANTTPPAAVTATNNGPLSCTLTTVTLTASSSTTGVTYRWLAPLTATSATTTVTTPGTYSVIITSVNGCTTIATTTVTSNTAVPVASINSLTLTCTNPTGTLTASVTGGTTPYTYRWNTGATTQSIPVSTSGTYSVVVTGANGCSTNAATTVTGNTAAPVASINSLTLTCTNPAGTLTASVTGGTTPYQYLWSTGGTAPTIAVNAAGPYSVTVTGANGCSAVANTTVISNTAAPVATINSLTLTCTNPTGTLTANVTGGIAPYAYRWNTTATTPAITVSAAGPYSVTVTGANGCSSSATTTVVSDTALPANVTATNNGPLSCTLTTVTLTASSSTANVTYRWLAPLTATSPTTTVITPGTYSVVVTSANGCSTVTTTTVGSSTLVPVATINSLTLTCTNPTGTLTASVTGGVAPYTYRWSNNATTQAITVNAAGPYSVTVTGANGCFTTATTSVVSDAAIPVASINSLTLTCTNPTGTLTANVTGGTTPYAYRWNTTATTPTITVSTAGPYSVTVTGANGCFTTATTTVVSDTALPTNVTATNNGPLSCTLTTATLTANSSTANVTYRWLAPLTATSATTTVTTPGTYSVVVTGANGCSTVATTTVTSNTAVPTASINSLTLTCANATGTLTASVTGSVAPYTYRWSNNATTPTITVGSAGSYSVLVSGANGCSASAVTTVTADEGQPSITLNSLTLTCAQTSGTLTANVTGGSAPISYLWSTNATTPTITVLTGGIYSVTVTSGNGCSAVANTTVISNTAAPVATINSLTLTCTNPTGTLTANVTGGIAPYAYRWNTTATTPAITVSAAGPYSVTVTGANGCSSSATTTVVSDTALPANVTATNNGPLSCTLTTVTLTASSSTANVTYRWLAPLTATSPTTTVITPGTYSVVVTSANGCSTVTTTTVGSSTLVPVATINSLTLTCTNPTGTLTASVTGGVAPYTYRWSNNATTQAITVNAAGPYSVTVTGANGCFTTATTSVVSDAAIPVASINSLTLTCTNPTGTLTANVTGGTTPYAYRWNTTATTPTITVSTAGPYSVTVTGANGCSTVVTTSVASDTAVPAASINSLTLTCTNPTGTLTANVTGGIAPYSYRWSTNATTSTITANSGGPYSVTITGANGCSTVATTTVVSDTAVPTATINSLTLSCANPTGTLTANVTGGVAPYTYRWSNNAITSTITVNTGGPYSVTVTGANGCFTTATITVNSDTSVPAATINNLTLSCANPTGTLTASVTGGIAPFTYRWSTNATTPTITVNAAGPYSVTVTGANGCFTTATTTVNSDTSVPAATINNLTLSCANPTGTLTANVTGGIAPFTYRWSTNATTPIITVNAAGPYSVTVTGANGCFITATTTVISDTAVPTATINSLTLTCNNPTGTLTANVTGGTTPYSYLWSNNATTQTITASAAGPYSVTVTGANGCSTVASTNVISDTALPANVTATNNGPLSCTVTTVTLTASSSTANVTYRWLAPLTATSATTTVNTPGTYSVVITSANGCSTVATTTVTSNTAVPVASINSLTLSCANPAGTLTASVTGGIAPYTYQWSTGASTPTINVTTAGPYLVSVTGANGCNTVATVTVGSDIAVPTLSVNSLTLTCAQPTGTLTVNATGGVAPYTYRWSTNATTPTIMANAAGPYSVTVTGANGCSNILTTNVASDTAVPTVSINSLTLSCANTTGILSASATGGTTPYSYLWSNNATTQTITASVSGPYSVTVTGATGCSTVATTTASADTAVPGVTINNLTLTCAQAAGNLTATVSGGTAPFTYLWSNNATTPSIAVGSAGTYSVVVTGANGCSGSATTTVTTETGQPNVTINNLTLTCANPTGTLTANATSGTSPYTYVWSNNATTQTITVSAAGPYSVTVTGANGCKAVATANVNSDTAVPTASVNSLTVTCANPTGTLSVSATGGTAPYFYLWSNNATTQTITASAAGPYSVTVTGANGCKVVATTSVVSDTAVPTASINSLTLTCANPTGVLTANVTGGSAPYTYLWSNNATTQTITASAAGPYSVTVTGANGCKVVATTSVVSDTAVPTASVNSLTLTCTNPAGILTPTVTGGTGPFTYQWNTGATTPTLSVTAAGVYVVTITGSNGCRVDASATVIGNLNPPTVLVNNLALTCADPTGTLTANVTGGTTPYRYLWSTGASTAAINVSAAGSYSVVVTGANGCSTVATATVTSSSAVPNVTVNSLTLTCANPTGTLIATTTGGTTPYSYQWSTGATSLSITVTTAGTYAVLVTGANGCSSSAITTVTSDTAIPTVTVNSLTLTCANPAGTLAATVTGGTAPFTYRWNTTETTLSITVSAAGPYSVTVTSGNGCSTVTTTTVSSNTTAPTATINSLTLNCANPTGTLSVNTTGGSAPYTYRWNNGGTTPTATVNTAGPYSVTVTGANGCFTTATTTVVSDTATPTVSVNSLTLTCAAPTGSLSTTVTGGVAPFTYRWSTNATIAAISVGSAGSYSVVVTGANGCSASAITTVSADASQPNLSLNSLTLTCSQPVGTLVATITDGIAPFTYRWSTGAVTPSIAVTTAALYSVTVTGSNGCIGVERTRVTSDTAVPALTLNSLTLTCANQTGILSASVTGGTTPYSYLWNNNATTPTITVSTAGPYSVTVTGGNGCSTSATTTVTSDTAVPTLSLNSLTLTCANPTGTLTVSATGGTTPYSYLWNTGANTPSITVNTAGPYSVTVTETNGCFAVISTTVTSNTAVPAASINGLTLTCANPTGILTVSATGGVAPYTYQWNTGATTASISVTAGGPYLVTVTGSNGCAVVATTTVQADKDAPMVSINSLTLTCANPTGILTANVTGGTAPYQYLWSTGSTTPTTSVSLAGPYSVTVTGTNGCFTVVTTSVASDTAIPVASINSLTLTCANPTGTLTVSVTGGVAPYTYQWSNNGSISPTITVGSAGSYSVVVTGANGCSTSATTTVSADAGQPVVSLNSLTLTCANPTGTLSASVTGGTTPYTYQWSTGAGTPTINVNTGGLYSVTVTGSNGCNALATTTVISNTAIPTVTLSPDNTVVTSGNSATLTVTCSTGSTILWSTGAASNGLTSIVVSPTATTTYSVTCITPAGCSGTASTTVTVRSTASLGSFVFEDLNGNGQQDAGEPGINGVAVTLLGGPAPISTTTVNGVYSFTGLTPGVSYTVVFSTPQGYTATLANQGNDATDSDADPVTGATTAIVLTPGQANNTVNAGFYQPASLGDKVFADLNRDGLQTVGEPGIGGVNITLISNNTVVATTTSQPDGTYSFTGLTPGVPYSVSFTAPANNTASPANVGGDDNVDSDIVNGVSQSVTLTSGQNNISVDAGFFPLRFDLSLSKAIAQAPALALPGDLIQYQLVLTNQGDLVATNTQITDYTPAGLVFNAINSPGFSLSGINAVATVASLAPGQSVTLTVAYNLTATSSQPIVNTAEITADSGDDFDSQPGNSPTNPNQDDTGSASFQTAQLASLGSFVFEDLNGNGQQDAGEPGINGVAVTLLGGPAPISTTTVNGVYSFTGLTPGVSYTVVFSTPQGYTATLANQGNDATDSDADPVTGRTTGYTLASGETNSTVNAGFLLIPRPCSLTITPVAGICTNATNGTVVSSIFSSTVTVNLTNPVAGVLTITDGANSLTLAVTASTSAITGTFSGLPSNGGNRTVTATLAGCSSASAIYQAPVPCQPVPANPMLTIDKTVSRSRAQAGDTLTYSVVLTNTGSVTAATAVRDSLSGGATYLAGSATVPASTTFMAGSPVSLWMVPSIAPGQSLTLTFGVRIDSTGILYNKATIPGDTAIACTSIPVVVCAGDQYIFTITAAPGRGTYRWFRNNVEVTDQTTNVFTITAPGSYSLATNNATGQCLDFSCCPFIVVEDTLPTFTAQAIPASCLGTQVRNDAKIILSSVNPAYKYQYSAGATFNAGASLSGAPQGIPTGGVIVSNLLNPATATAYTVRVYNRSGCYKDVVVNLLPTVCNCPAEVCVPYVLKQTKRGKRIGDPVVK